jgi:PhnB protein
MAINSLNPYLCFEGTAQKAIDLYSKALGAKVEGLMRYGDVPGNEQPQKNKDLVMHAKLQVGGGVVMLSDVRPGDTAASGRQVQIALHFDDPVEMGRKFEALSQGGRIELPLQDMFWGAKFGMLTDAFGVSWMFNCDKKR